MRGERVRTERQVRPDRQSRVKITRDKMSHIVDSGELHTGSWNWKGRVDSQVREASPEAVSLES